MTLILIAALLVAALAAVFFFVQVASKRRWVWTGFLGEPANVKGERATPPKRLWDWLDLLAVPLVIALGVTGIGYLQSLNEAERADRRADVDTEIALNAQRERTLQDYFDAMTTLMLEQNIQARAEGGVTPAQRVAAARTLSTLRSLDGERKGIVVRFLADSDLIREGEESLPPPLLLRGADLSDAILAGACLWRIHLERPNLARADLSGAFLDESYLQGANLTDAHLEDALMNDVILSDSDLTRAVLTNADLVDAHLSAVHGQDANLAGAILQKATGNFADLERPNLENVVISSDSDLENADLSRAEVRPWDGPDTGRGGECLFLGFTHHRNASVW